ncbi:MAG: magnesium/cobalt transporter CorA [Betaproteobacteria bacterium]|uniref:Magnesium transport protein CorA n=1 Tax=Candidatus Proximibacter danicus TaxID=2954365 RepID=A0A9D7K6A6_9PROT|nr:magnesium/cobalt transporter CorA [Candidatus Proximibacter danicus]
MPRKKKLRSSKAGLPPGALVHIGEVKTSLPSVTLTGYGDANGVTERELPDISMLDSEENNFPVRWLNIYGLHDAALLSAIGKRFDLHPLVLEDILNTDQRPKIDAYADYLYVVAQVYDPSRPRTDFATDQISIVIGHDFILTFQEQKTGTFEPIRQRLRAEKNAIRKQGCDYLAYALLDTLVDSYFRIIERLSDQCDDLEEEILGVPKRGALQKAHALKRQLSHLRRLIWPLQEVMSSLQRNQSEFFGNETRLYLRDIYDHTVHLLEQLEDLRDLLSGLLDIYLNSVSNRVNMEVRALTVVTTMFMPAALVTGIFGMNFRSMPLLDSPTGFWLALTAMASVALLMLALFWRRRLLR